MIERRPFNELAGADHGWLKAKHHFSFGEHADPTRMGWGTLRVWNDDEIAPNTGFPPHPHANMEIITYVREGAVTHSSHPFPKGNCSGRFVTLASGFDSRGPRNGVGADDPGRHHAYHMARRALRMATGLGAHGKAQRPRCNIAGARREFWCGLRLGNAVAWRRWLSCGLFTAKHRNRDWDRSGLMKPFNETMRESHA
jgi:Pirin